MYRTTIYVDRVNGGYEASIDTDSGRFIRFSTCEQDAIGALCRAQGLNRNYDNVRIVRIY